MRRIGITQQIEFVQERNELRSTLDLNWSSFFHQAGLGLAPLPNTRIKNFDEKYLREFDGFVFSGGGNITNLCEFQEEKNIQILRDKLEKYIFNYCIEKNIPIIGICRGMQQLAHQFACTFVRSNDLPATCHDLTTSTENSFCLPDVVNSFHDWAISSNEFPSELEIIALDSHGNVEAMKHKKLPLYGLMWHPERTLCSDSKNSKFFKDVFDGV